jgi:type IV pilus assembly protein PilY1
MRIKPEKIIRAVSLIMLGMLSMLFAAGTAVADDTDVYQAMVKNNTLLLIDISGSMTLPVYDHNIDYTAFLNWAEDPDTTAPAQTEICVWQKWNSSGQCYYDYSRVIPHRINASSPIPVDDQEEGYEFLSKMKWEKDKIYLVSADVGYREIEDEDGNTTSMVGDYLWYSNDKVNYRLINYGVIDTGWEITDWSDPEGNTIATDEDGWVVYPDFATLSDPVMGKPVSWYSENLAGQRFHNYAATQITNVVTDNATGITRDVGFLGFLKAPGIVFSGLFRTNFNGNHILTATPSQAYKASSDEHVVYGFVTGNYLSFIKLANGLRGMDGDPCTWDWNVPSKKWRSICYQPVEQFTVSGINIRSHGQNHQEDFDYITIAQGINGPGYKEKTPIQPPGFIYSIRIQFEFLDMDACGGDPDYVEFRDADNNVLLRIKGQNLGPGAEGTVAYAGYQVGDQGGTWSPGNYIDDSTGWTEWLEVNTESIRVFFFNGTDGDDCDNGPEGDNKTRGFNIIGYEYYSTSTESAEISCCNGSDGMGYQIQSRIDVAKMAMANVVDATKDKLNWGLAVYPEGGSAGLRTDFDEGPEAVIADLLAIDANGSTPTGMAMQQSYNFFDTYLDSDPEAAACANNYLLLMTDGYPNGDYSWNLVNTNTGQNPVFTWDTYQDGDSWTWGWSGVDDEHGDDVASWMAGWKNAQPVEAGGKGPDYNVTTHAIGFNFDNPLLADIADDGSGLCITANNRNELIEAFYTLGLAMTSTTSFIAPVVSVDEANRTQSGDEIYMALFRPVEDDHWEGNLKKFGLAWKVRSDCGRTEWEWTVVDKNGNTATDCDGTIRDSAISYWSASADGITVNKGGAGRLLLNAINGASSESPYDFRYIYTYKDSALMPFTYDTINDNDFLHGEDLGMNQNDEALEKIVNFVYGYTYDANDDGTPVAKRTWVLGDIIHSEPEIIEYHDPQNGLLRRLIAVGANDGMLHVFVDYDTLTDLPEGSELFAFVPPDLIDDIQYFENPGHFYTMDGSANLWQGSVVDENENDQWDTDEYRKKILVFGERRGGRSYWALDVTDPVPGNWSVAWRIRGGDDSFEALGQTWNKPQFARIRTSSTTFKDVCIFAGGYDDMEDNYPEPFEDNLLDPDGIRDDDEDYNDLNHNDEYDIHNLDGTNDMGRGIYVVDVTDGSVVFSKDYEDEGYDQMKWCFPADPTVISFSTNKLLIYAPDIYGQIWRVSYTYKVSEAFEDRWSADCIFTANPGSDLDTGSTDLKHAHEDEDDQGRKMFYGPDVSYGGNCWIGYPVLYFGTGDREHPNHSMVSNRFYVVKDAYGDVTDETDLLNLTCNELEDWTVPDLDGDGSSDQDDVDIQNELKDLLYPSEDYPAGQARGWYRILDQQGDCVTGADDHTGEKMLCQPSLYFKNLYFTTYQPVYDDPCAAGGDTRIYAIDYCWGSSAFDLYLLNNNGDDDIRDIRDTYHLIASTTIASGVRIVTRGGSAAGVISVSGAVSGVGKDLSTRIPSPPGGITRMLWETD